MSRIGNRPIAIPEDVDVNVDGQTVEASGPAGDLSLEVARDLTVAMDDGALVVERPTNQTRHKALHGLMRSLLSNLIQGVHEGFEKRLEIHGTGYRARLAGQTLELTVGFSHPVRIEPSDQIDIEVPNETSILVKGADKQQVGEVAAKIRDVRPPEPYLGKGIRYRGERVRRKEGKTAT